jgi:hypothetical protein
MSGAGGFSLVPHAASQRIDIGNNHFRSTQTPPIQNTVVTDLQCGILSEYMHATVHCCSVAPRVQNWP